jgi:hypothetical protein
LDGQNSTSTIFGTPGQHGWLAISGATTRELMARVGHASPAAALRYQHATEDRDTALANAFSEMVKTPSVASISDRPRDIRGMAAVAGGP